MPTKPKDKPAAVKTVRPGQTPADRRNLANRLAGRPVKESK